MRIGIFTLVGSTNYGGALQAFAMSEYLRQYGHNPEFVRVRGENGLSTFRRLTGILTTYTTRELFLLLMSDRVLKRQSIHSTYNPIISKVFDKFYDDNITMLDHVNESELPEFVKRYDALIVGSDQVWTDLYASNQYFFFDSFENYNGIRISYAACSAHQKAAIYNRKKISKLLNRFNGISVRDTTTKRLVQRYTKRDVTLVADPTLIVDFSKYLPKATYSEPYIFCYILGEEPKGGGHGEAIRRIKEKVGNIKVIAINRTRNDYEPYYDEERNEASPFEWIRLIANAKYVYTDSFHAILFSLRYHKPMLAYYTEAVRSSRLLDLRYRYGLGSNITGSLEDLIISDIDWENSDREMQKLVDTSKNFLEQQLKRQ